MVAADAGQGALVAAKAGDNGEEEVAGSSAASSCNARYDRYQKESCVGLARENAFVAAEASFEAVAVVAASTDFVGS